MSINILPKPRVLLSIDFEPWYTLCGRYDLLTDDIARRKLDGGFSKEALESILSMLEGAPISFYLVGELVNWFPDIPQRIVDAGHEIGFHCHRHRTFRDAEDLRADLVASRDWLTAYSVKGFRAPRVTIFESCYRVLKEAGLQYSSSVYATSGRVLDKDGIWEVPVSTRRIFGAHREEVEVPRTLSLSLLRGGELPIGSSLMSGISEDVVINLIKRELADGLSPAIVLHSFELFCPQPWSRYVRRNLYRQPSMLPFIRSKVTFLKKLLSSFPTSSMQTYLNEFLELRGRTGV